MAKAVRAFFLAGTWGQRAFVFPQAEPRSLGVGLGFAVASLLW